MVSLNIKEGKPVECKNIAENFLIRFLSKLTLEFANFLKLIIELNYFLNFYSRIYVIRNMFELFSKIE